MFKVTIHKIANSDLIKKMTASTKLYLLVFVLLTFIIGIGAFSFFELKAMNEDTQTIYADRILPMEQLTTIRFAYAMSILSTAQQLRTNQMDFATATKKIREAEETIKNNWKAYKGTRLITEEAQLADRIDALMVKANFAVEKLYVLPEKTEVGQAVIYNDVYASVAPVIEKVNELILLQVSVSGDVYKNSKLSFSSTSTKFAVLIFLCLLFAIPFSFYIARNVKDLIKDLRTTNIKMTESEEKYRSLVEHAGDPIFLLDSDTYFVEVNPSGCILLGYTPEEFLCMKISDVFAPEELETRPLQIEFLQKNKVLLNERKWRKKDGTCVDVEINVRLLDDNRYLGIARDITQRKRIEETLRVSEKKYRNIFENVQDVFYQTTLSGTVLDVSPSVITHLGFTRDEVIGAGVSDVYYDITERKRGIEILSREGELKDYEIRLKSKSGELVYASLNARIIPHDVDMPEHIDGAFKNITESKRIAELLIENKVKLALFIEHSPAALAMFDTDMRYIATSRRWITDYNLDASDLIGKKHYDVFPEIPQKWKDVHQLCLKGDIQKNEEDSFIRTDGTREWIRWEIHPWQKADGEIGGIIMFTEVITDRKNAQAEIIALNETLEHKVMERTAELVRANDSLDTFSSSVSHDLRSPVRAIISFIRIIEKDYGAGFTDHLKGLFDHIRKSSMRMNSIIEDLLTLARYDKAKLNPETLDMKQLFSKVWENILINSPHLATIHLEDLPITKADISLIEQVVVNLLSNAIKYSSKNEKPAVHVGFERTIGMVTFSVKDNGVGFDMKDYNRLFGAFQRLHGANEFEGTGVGLLLVKRIINKHGGEVWAESEVNKGARFCFSLPEVEVS